jgi:hypothetical protein
MVPEQKKKRILKTKRLWGEVRGSTGLAMIEVRILLPRQRIPTSEQESALVGERESQEFELSCLFQN